MKRPAVYLIGAGPGDPGLITVRGLHHLRGADVVVYDHLVPARLLKYARHGAELIDVGTAAPQLFPAGLRLADGAVPIYFEAAAVITVLVLLGQVLELRAREKTSGAIRAWGGRFVVPILSVEVIA